MRGAQVARAFDELLGRHREELDFVLGGVRIEERLLAAVDRVARARRTRPQVRRAMPPGVRRRSRRRGRDLPRRDSARIRAARRCSRLAGLRAVSATSSHDRMMRCESQASPDSSRRRRVTRPSSSCDLVLDPERARDRRGSTAGRRRGCRHVRAAAGRPGPAIVARISSVISRPLQPTNSFSREERQHEAVEPARERRGRQSRAAVARCGATAARMAAGQRCRRRRRPAPPPQQGGSSRHGEHRARRPPGWQRSRALTRAFSRRSS